jgi:hypothetical protein
VRWSVLTCYSGGFFYGRNGGWISWARHRVILVVHNEPPSSGLELVGNSRKYLQGNIHGKVMELFEKGTIADDFVAFAPAEGSFKGDRVGKSSMRAWCAAFLVAAEAHFSKLSLQRRK